jgi:hypothetical protein
VDLQYVWTRILTDNARQNYTFHPFTLQQKVY